MLKAWSLEAFPNSQKLIEQHTIDLNQCLIGDFTAEIMTNIEIAWDREEKYWHQRSRVNWLRAGDQSSKFFHSTNCR